MSQPTSPPSPALPTIARGHGVYVYDEDGRQYFDGSGGAAIFALGHGNEEVNAAIQAQLARIAHGYRYHFDSEPLRQLRAILADRCGGGLRHAVLVGSGSEAVESCLKIALQYQQAIGQTRRTRFISRQRSYHGNTLGALAVSGHVRRRQWFEGGLMPASFLSPANTYRPPAGVPPEAVADFCAQELEAEIVRLGPENVCAFIFEPIVGAAGCVVPAPPGYAQRVRAVCDRYEVLLIADEVMCGSGRSGTWRALAHDGVEPDLMALAKGLGAGYIPLGAAVFHERVAAPILAAHGEVMTGHTFTGHTTACAAAVAVQTIIARERLVEKVAADGPWLLALLRSVLGEHPHVGDIRGRGYFIGIELVADRETKTPFAPEQGLAARLKRETMAQGLICYPVSGIVDGVQGDGIILAPPYIATRAELEEMVDRLVGALKG